MDGGFIATDTNSNISNMMLFESSEVDMVFDFNKKTP